MGPLVFVYICRFKPLDSTGQPQSGAFREPSKRVEGASVDVLAQVRPKSLAALSMWVGGRDLEEDTFVFCHITDLTRRGLIDDDTGMPITPRIGDRLDEMRNSRNKLVIKINDPPGAFVQSVMPASFGPGGANALFEVRLAARRSSR